MLVVAAAVSVVVVVAVVLVVGVGMSLQICNTPVGCELCISYLDVVVAASVGIP